jgi:uncharacterized membrane protein
MGEEGRRGGERRWNGVVYCTRGRLLCFFSANGSLFPTIAAVSRISPSTRCRGRAMVAAVSPLGLARGDSFGVYPKKDISLLNEDISVRHQMVLQSVLGF